jgi:hypothetical protein
LEAVASFDEVMDLVANMIQNIRAIDEPGRAPGMEGCVRPILTITAPGAFDAFFNAAAGYRGQFWQDPEGGQAANGRIIRHLMNPLVAAIEAANLERLRSIDPRTSLSAVSAKIWIHEDDFPFDALTRDLAVEPWYSAANRGVNQARHGVCAPADARIRVFGAWIDKHGHERVHRDKILRRSELHEYGFS